MSDNMIPEPEYDPEWEKHLVEDADLIRGSETDAVEAVQTMNAEIIEDALQDLPWHKNTEPPEEPKYFTPGSNMHPGLGEMHLNMTQRVNAVADMLNLRKDQLKREKQLAKLKRSLAMLEADAINNWDDKAKAPKDPEMPYNDGSNPEKRAAINRRLFKVLYEEIEAMEEYGFTDTLRMMDLEANLKELEIVHRYHDDYMRLTEMFKN